LLRYVILAALLIPIIWLCALGDTRRRKKAEADAANDEQRPAA
jgi:hypothetical protein